MRADSNRERRRGQGYVVIVCFAASLFPLHYYPMVVVRSSLHPFFQGAADPAIKVRLRPAL